MRSLASGSLVLASLAAVIVACGSSQPPPPPSPSTPTTASSAPTKPAAGQDDDAKKNAAIEKLTSEESKSGNCDPDTKAALEKLLADVETAMKAKNGEDGKPLAMQTVGKRVLALGSNAKGVELSVSGRGTELHVLAFGLRDVSLDVLAGKSAASTLRSPHQRTAVTPLVIDVPKIGKITEVPTDSRQVQIKVGEPLEVKLTGQGCAGMISFLKP